MAENDHLEMLGERQSVLVRDQKYRDNTNSGFIEGDWQAHHILCNHAVAARKPDPECKDYVEKCLWVTKWDLNNSDNMIGLPTNKQYKDSEGSKPVNLPSHMVDHNTKDGFTDECTKWLKDNVWDALKAEQEDHGFKPKDIADMLNNGSSHFRTQLEERGRRKGGTLRCWNSRFPPDDNEDKRGKAQYEELWYFPFSMAEDAHVNPRHPGVRKNGTLTYAFKKLTKAETSSGSGGLGNANP